VAHSQRILVELGRRIRAARAQAGLSLADLARQAAVSRRHVTEAEAGRANLSILKLADLASALGVPLRNLFDFDTRIRGAERIALVGLRGAGKSTVGRALALALEAPFVELDQRVEELAGLRLAEIFSLHGDVGFHRFEREALAQVLSEGERFVIATGGSIVADEANFARLLARCRTIWLRAGAEDHYGRVIAQGDRRPMDNRPRAMAELEALLRAREPAYARCEITIDTGHRSPPEVVRAILEALAPADPGSSSRA
jgi:XRE family aerobic/anaerobic benzoate catabolism transcriptional regulator